MLFFTGVFVKHPLSVTVEANTTTTLNFSCTIKARKKCTKTDISWRICDFENECQLIPDNDGVCIGKKKTAVREITVPRTIVIQCEENYKSLPTIYSKVAILVVKPPSSDQG